MMEVLRAKLIKHLGMPTAIGSGRCDIRYKAHALIHGERLQQKSWKSALAALHGTFTYTCDLGTESRLNAVRCKLSDLFGAWVHEPNTVDVADDAAFNVEPAQEQGALLDADGAGMNGVAEDGQGMFNIEEAGAPAAAAAHRARAPCGGAAEGGGDAELRVDFTRLVYIPGLLHVLGNCLAGIKDAGLKGWKDLVSQLKELCRLLARPDLRQRLMQTCFAEEPARHWQHYFAHFSARVYEGRWESMINAVSQVLGIERPLRAAWSLQKFAHRPRAQPDAQVRQAQGPGDERLDTDVVDTAIRSDLFWAYLHLLDIALESVEKMIAWAEGCPCCWRQTPFEGPERWVVRRARRQAAASARDRARIAGGEGSQKACALCGLRAPEMAAGFLMVLLRSLLDVANAALLLRPCVLALNEAGRAQLLVDFATLRRYLHFTLRLKTAHWRQLPWLLFGLAHWDRPQANECGRRALRLYASAGEGTREHWLTGALCGLQPGRRVH